uniref:Non-haem dioxygenase N-terminal domain-containing protein n=1 Tax=Brassica oleracea var. oleracea TaxID=109376 RepID=A0A0D3B329_BRAOL
RTKKCIYVAISKDQTYDIHWYTLYVKPNGETSEHRLVHIPSLPLMPLHGSYVAVGSNIFVMGEFQDWSITSTVSLIVCRSQTTQPLSDMLKACKEKTLSDIAKACEEWGFFQLVSHGTPLELLNKVKELSSDCYKIEREEAFKTSTPVKLLNELLEKNSGEKLESVDWEDVFTLLDHNQNEWPSNISGLKETMLEYIGEVMKLASKMMEVMD